MLKKAHILLAITLIFSRTVKAEEVITLNKGDIAPFSGILMDNKKANEIRTQLLDVDFYKALNESYSKSISIYKNNEALSEQKSNILLEQNTKLINEINTRAAISKWENIAWFGLGIFVTVAGGLIVRQAAK